MFKPMTNHMPVMSGRILPINTPVSVLMGTGCSTCVIKLSLVKPEQMTRDHSKVAPIDGPVKGFPAAKIGILVRNKHCVCPNVYVRL